MNGRDGLDRRDRAGAERLVRSLDDALALLRDVERPAETPQVDGPARATLLQQCLAMCEQPTPDEHEPVRTVHHLACTGGTLICKCIAAMPNVQLLSEVDPLSTLRWNRAVPQFAPTDTALQLRQSTRGTSESLLVRLFAGNLRLIHAETSSLGQRLVLRDHAHSHFCVGPEVPPRPTLREMLPAELPALSVVTVRHPYDSLASLINNGWVHFQPGTLDEYCRRYLAFLDRHADLPVLQYEAFVERPVETMRTICTILRLPFAEGFVEVFDVFKLTGDSGRAGQHIEPRPRRPLPAALRDEVAHSPACAALCRRLDYDTDPG